MLTRLIQKLLGSASTAGRQFLDREARIALPPRAWPSPPRTGLASGPWVGGALTSPARHKPERPFPGDAAPSLVPPSTHDHTLANPRC